MKLLKNILSANKNARLVEQLRDEKECTLEVLKVTNKSLEQQETEIKSLKKELKATKEKYEYQKNVAVKGWKDKYMNSKGLDAKEEKPRNHVLVKKGFKIWDKVEVKDKRKIYSTYDIWAEKHKLRKFKYWDEPYTFIWKIVAIWKHLKIKETLYWVRIKWTDYIYWKKWLKLWN